MNLNTSPSSVVRPLSMKSVVYDLPLTVYLPSNQPPLEQETSTCELEVPANTSCA
eukprot:CAMPEP_0180523488 /NCGR_PEP_ID=MMETSP1036_2-20121128/58058_1 /TAXON_ID=632150 /ORGANISM="Azadinium spinosum, Strain 3D9" /LENGTH=54 /DNA_ID=CAMNT_0022536517 /DNA_START=272 /DNA_END=436 /DNA_ORIENTATION=+